MMYLCLLLALTTIHIDRHVLVSHDYGKAQQIAHVFDKPMILFFTGSDWDAESKTFIDTVLPKTSFYNRLKKDFVLTQLDFPELSTQTGEQIEQNHALKERYQVSSFPTLVLTDSAGREISRTGLIPDLADHLQALYARYQHILEALSMENLSFEQLKECYIDARALGCEHLVEKALEQGLQTASDPYFHLEKYAQLIHDQNPNAPALHATILKMDPANLYGASYRLAILDFQSLADTDPTRAIEPILQYIHKFGRQDTEHVWRLHQMAAQYLYAHGQTQQALEHARDAFQAAPSHMKSDLSHTLEVIQAQGA